MPPPLLMDLSQIETTRVIFDHASIYSRMPHRFEFELLDGICHFDRQASTAVAYLDCRADAWWARGHVPGLPILPGVLQIEAAAQLTAFLARYVDGCDIFIALGGIEDCRFREAVMPPSRLFITCKLTENRPRRVTAALQGLVENRIMFEATIIGMAMPAIKM